MLAPQTGEPSLRGGGQQRTGPHRQEQQAQLRIAHVQHLRGAERQQGVLRRKTADGRPAGGDRDPTARRRMVAGRCGGSQPATGPQEGDRKATH